MSFIKNQTINEPNEKENIIPYSSYNSIKLPRRLKPNDMVTQKKYAFKINLSLLDGLSKQKNKNRFINDAIKSKLDEQAMVKAVWEKLKNN